MAIMGMLGVTMAYVMRACLGITLTQMVKTIVVDSGPKGDYCPMPEMPGRSSNKSNRFVVNNDFGGQFDWDEETQGKVLSAFYYGYIVTHLPGGALSQKFGGKHVMGFGILSTAVFTLMTPFVARMGSTELTILRFVEGLGEVRCRFFFLFIDLLISHGVFQGYDISCSLYAPGTVGTRRRKGKTLYARVCR